MSASYEGTLKTTTYPNKYNVVVPPESPFYRSSLVLKNDKGRELIEGLDYYLGYYYKDATEAYKDQIYGGIILTGETSVSYKITSVSRDFYVPQSELGKFLVSVDLRDPRNVDWSELMKYAPVIPAIDPPKSYEEALLRDDIVKALDELRRHIFDHAQEMDGAYSEVTDLIFRNGQKIFQDNLYQHHLIKNAHTYTAEEVGALKVIQRAVNATKAFSLDLDTLVGYMASWGIQTQHLDALLSHYIGEIRGRIRVLNNDSIVFTTQDNKHRIVLQGDKIVVATTAGMEFTADQYGDTGGVGVEFASGLNTMLIASTANAPIYNGCYLITPDMVNIYLSAVTIFPANAYFAPSDTVKLYGSAKEASPLFPDANYPTASQTEPGMFLITSLATDLTYGAAISQQAVTVLKEQLDNYVDDTYTINNQSFVHANGNATLTLTKRDFNLENVDNTTTAGKPVTDAMASALTLKSPVNHTHVFADLIGVPIATDTVAGLVKLINAINTATDGVVSSRQGYVVQQSIDALTLKANDLLPSWTMGGQTFSNIGYLPIPAVGNYHGFLKKTGNNGFGVVMQENDLVYALRNANDGLPNTDGIYYACGLVDQNGLITRRQQTSYAYSPVGLMTAYPNVALQSIEICGQDGIVCVGSDNQRYLVLFDGTLNAKKHKRVARVTWPQITVDGNTSVFVGNPMTDHVVVRGNIVYVVRVEITNRVYRTLVLNATFTTGQSLTFTVLSLTGGDSKNGSYSNIKADTAIAGSDPATNGISYVTSAGAAKWTTRNISHGPMANRAVAMREEKIRVCLVCGIYLANVSDSYGWRRWATSFTIDLTTAALTLENPEHFPLKIDVDGITFANGKTVDDINFPVKWENGSSSDRTWVTGQGNTLWSFFDKKDDIAPAGLGRSLLPDGVEFYDYIECHNTQEAGLTDTWLFDGGVGSVFTVGYNCPVYLGHNEYLFSPVDGNAAIFATIDPNSSYSETIGGAGPTTTRYSFDMDTYYTLGNMPWVASGSLQAGRLDGCYWTDYGSKKYKAMGRTPSTATMTITQTEWYKIVGAIKSGAPQGSANGYAYEYINGADTALYSVLAVSPASVNAVWLAQVVCFTIRNGQRVIDHYLFQFTPTVNNGNVSLVAGAVNLVWYTNNPPSSTSAISVTDYRAHTQRFVQPIYFDKGDGNVFLYLPNAYRADIIGDTLTVNLELALRLTNGQLSFVKGGTVANPFYYAPSYLTILNEKLVRGDLTSVSPAYVAGPATPITDILTVVPGGNAPGANVEIVAGAKTAEGWILYITDTVEWRIGSSYYLLDPWQADIKSLFPAGYQNQRFYLHVLLQNGVANYELMTAPQPDSTTSLFIGTVDTDDARITTKDIDKVRRLGAVKQLVEHTGTQYSHDVDIATELRLSKFGLLSKAGLGNAGTPGSYLSTRSTEPSVGQQPRKSAVAPITKSVTVGFADTGNLAYQFYPPVTAARATASENITANSVPCYWIGRYAPYVPSTLLRYASSVKITPSQSNIVVRVFIPNQQVAGSGSTDVVVNGITQTIQHGGVGDFAITVVANQLFEVVISGSITPANLSWWGEKFVGFAIYDHDVSTNKATLLTVSNADSQLIIDCDDPDGYPGTVQAAERIALPVSTSDYYPIVTAGGVKSSPPVTVEANSVLVVTAWGGLTGREKAVDLAVNLMPRYD